MLARRIILIDKVAREKYSYGIMHVSPYVTYWQEADPYAKTMDDYWRIRIVMLVRDQNVEVIMQYERPVGPGTQVDPTASVNVNSTSVPFSWVSASEPGGNSYIKCISADDAEFYWKDPGLAIKFKIATVIDGKWEVTGGGSKLDASDY